MKTPKWEEEPWSRVQGLPISNSLCLYDIVQGGIVHGGLVLPHPWIGPYNSLGQDGLQRCVALTTSPFVTPYPEQGEQMPSPQKARCTNSGDLYPGVSPRSPDNLASISYHPSHWTLVTERGGESSQACRPGKCLVGTLIQRESWQNLEPPRLTILHHKTCLLLRSNRKFTGGCRDGPTSNSAKPEFRLQDPQSERRRLAPTSQPLTSTYLLSVCLLVCLSVCLFLSLYINKHTIKKNKAALNIYVKTKIFFWKIF